MQQSVAAEHVGWQCSRLAIVGDVPAIGRAKKYKPINGVERENPATEAYSTVRPEKREKAVELKTILFELRSLVVKNINKSMMASHGNKRTRVTYH